MAERGAIALRDAHRVTPADDPDFFPTPPWAARAGAELVTRHFDRARDLVALDPACGALHMAHGVQDYFPTVLTSDAYPYDGNRICDFLADDMGWAGPDWIFTNPPFIHLEAFIRRAWAIARRGVAMLVKVNALESVGRYTLHTQDCPLTVFAPFSERVPMHKGRWEPDGSTAAFYTWLIWLKPPLRPHRFMARIGGQWCPGTYLIAPGAEARLTRPSDAELFGAQDRPRGGE